MIRDRTSLALVGVFIFKRIFNQITDLMDTIFKELAKNNFSLHGQRGIVTGGSGGIGKAIAIMLAKAGAEVFVLSRSGRFKDHEKVPENLYHIKTSIVDAGKCRQIIDEIGKKGLDFLVNNAGITVKSKLVDLDIEDWNAIQEVNVKAAMNLSKFAYPYLKKSSTIGRIVNITSMASYLAFNDVVPYVVSKTGLLGLTRGLCVEWAKENILVNSVSPGWIKTNMVEQVLDEEREKKILNKMPLHKYGKPEDIASMVWYLVSPASKYITGQDFSVDGGALVYGY